MKMMAWLTSALCLMSVITQAGELEDKISSLRKNYDALEGYWAMYEAKTETGKSATFEQGADFASGWAFVRMELRDAKGDLMAANEQWSTNKGDYVMRNGDEVIVFTGFGGIGERADQLRKLLKRNGEITSMRITPNCYLTKTEVIGGVGFSTAGRPWFTDIIDLVSFNEKEITLDWGEHGTIIVDQSSGLLISQVIDLDNGTREMTRTDWQRNPGAKMIASRMNINLEGAKKNSVVELGMGRKLLGAIFQSMIEEIEKDPDLGTDLEGFLRKREGAVAEYLDQEILPEAPILKGQNLIQMIESASLESQQHFKQKGINITLEQLHKDADFQAEIVTNLANGLIKKDAGLNREKYVQDTLAGPLIAKGKTEEMAKSLIEESVERAGLYAKIKQAADAFKEQQWGR